MTFVMNIDWRPSLLGICSRLDGNKGEILPDFSLEFTQNNITKRGDGDEVWTKLLS